MTALEDEARFSTSSVVAMASWLTSLVLLLVAWGLFAGGDHMYLAILLAETGCVVSAVAAVVQIRCYSARVCRLIRVANGLERPTEAAIQPFPTLR